MSNRLKVVRHAKSDRDDPTLTDHDRPLARRGVNALALMRDHLAADPRPVDTVLCSTARRAVETLGGIRSALSDDAHIEIERELYGATALGLVDRLRRIDGDPATVMLVGHNPGLEDLVLLLARDGDLRDQVALKYPTGAIATLSFEGGWSDLAPVAADLDDLFFPRRPRT